jgi:NAD(P)-dependent dehydrogenase (short-subunit alcohol dehydrogenase family)
MSFQGKTFLVTGASSGIGRAVTLQICAQGGAVIGLARDPKKLAAVFQELPGSKAIAFDVTDFANYPKLLSQLPPLDGVLHSAGPLYMQASRLMRLTDVESVMHPHLFAPLLMTSELLREKKIQDGGSVVFISSTAALSPSKSLTLYGTAKAALLAAMRGFTAEVTPRNGIRFNTVLPGLVDTPMLKERRAKIGGTEENPGEVGRPEDVAEPICFLLSAKARWVAGASLTVDGGASCSNP